MYDDHGQSLLTLITMTTEGAFLVRETAIDACLSEKDSLEDLSIDEDGAEKQTGTKENQDVAAHNSDRVNESVQKIQETNDHNDNTDKTSPSTTSNDGSSDNIDAVTTDPEEHILQGELGANCPIFNYKISRRRTIHGVEILPKANSTKDLRRQTSDFGRLSLSRPKGSTLNLTCPGESPCVRETLTSRLRFEKGHVSHDLQGCDGKTYVTPTQRKDMEMRQLKKEVKELKKDIAERVEEIDLLKKNIDKEATDIIESKDLKIKEIRVELDTMMANQDELKSSYDQAQEKVAALENTVEKLKAVIAEKEHKNADIYYEMYRKGQESAKFERNFEIERLAAISGKATSVTTRELLEKLMDTEMELAKWQSYRRRESYESGERPETEAAAILQFLKDSFYHYITDQKQSDNHLRAMIRIFSYTEPQKKKIASAIAERINKKNSL